MLFVSTLLRGANIFNNHIANSFEAVLLMHKVGSECCRRNLRHMLMFCNGQHFLFGEATKRYAVFKSYHLAVEACGN